MSYGLVSMYNVAYEELAQLTHVQNKVLYAKKYNYELYTKTSNFSTTYNINFEKVFIILEAFKSNPDLEWCFWLDCDAVVTNFNVKIEDHVDNNYHFVISSDVNGLNAGSFLVRNSPRGVAYLEEIGSNAYNYAHTLWQEQQYIVDTYEQHKDIIKVVPQKNINSYNYELYSNSYEKNEKWYLAYSDGNWEPGHYVLHWPGVPNHTRLELAKKVQNQIVF